MQNTWSNRDGDEVLVIPEMTAKSFLGVICTPKEKNRQLEKRDTLGVKHTYLTLRHYGGVLAPLRHTFDTLNADGTRVD